MTLVISWGGVLLAITLLGEPPTFGGEIPLRSRAQHELEEGLSASKSSLPSDTIAQ